MCGFENSLRCYIISIKKTILLGKMFSVLIRDLWHTVIKTFFSYTDIQNIIEQYLKIPNHQFIKKIFLIYFL